MKRVGIFLAYAPEQSIRKEGLGRLLAFMIKGALNRDDYTIVVACPRWYRQELKHLFDDHDIDASQVEVLTTDHDSYLMRFRNWSLRRSRRPAPRRRASWKGLIFRLRSQMLRSIVNAGVSVSFGNAAAFGMRAIFFAFLVFLIGLLAAPILILRELLGLLPVNARARLRALQNLATSPATALMSASLMREVYAEMRKHELSRLIDKINACHDIDGWLVPNLFWPEIADIKARTVVVAPDIVFFQFPTHFAKNFTKVFLERAQIIARRADHFITYSDFVRDEHLVGGLGVPGPKISVVRHGRVSLSEYLQLGGARPSPELRREIALNIVDVNQNALRGSGLPWTMLDFDKARYLFYSSQMRHHKNIFLLIKVVEELNRKDKIDIRLILTANLYESDRIVQYVNDRGLNDIILSAHDIPSKLLAAMASLATLAITPTLFEGGFPFTFCEAYSVGTPSIISNIPVVREVMDNFSPEMRERTLFLAHNAASLKSKILWGMENREALFLLQAELYDAYPTWEEVAGQYLKIVTSSDRSGENHR